MSSRSLPSKSSLFTSEGGSSAPRYTAKPLTDEVTLEGSSLSGLSTGDFERASGPLALLLHGQIDGVSRPTMYHMQHIRGAVSVQPEECSGTTKVSLKVNLCLPINNPSVDLRASPVRRNPHPAD